MTAPGPVSVQGSAQGTAPSLDRPTDPGQRILSIWQYICYGVLSLPMAMGGLAVVFFLPSFYAGQMGLGLTAVGIVFAAGRILDVLTDPILGNLSDETRTRWGARRPWIVLGVPAYCIAVWMLLVPPDGIGLIYLILASSFYFLLYTIVDVPYSSIGLEISPHVHERSYLASARGAFQVAGAILAAILPVALLLQPRDGLQTTALVIVVMMGVGLLAYMFFLPVHDRAVHVPRQPFWVATRQVLAVRRFRVLVLGFAIIQAANALTAALTVMFITHVIAAPAALANGLTALVFLSSAVFFPLWIILSKRYSKSAAWMISMVLAIVVLASAFGLGPGQIIAAAILCIIVGACFGCDAIMPTSLLADIVYEFEARGDNRLAGVFLALKNAVSKLAFIVPMALAFPLLDFVGFDAAGPNAPADLMTLTVLFAGIPVILRCLALIVLRRANAFPPAPSY